ncbi:cytidylate kinase [Paenibacillus sp. UNCCL117]|uniref:(d)CMP kinase n=1 Tax=unclassified Paenibacillus TaxID=185978 RepID=UPI0008818E46|nr:MULTISPECIES: (d)CMP kinase [unclassified Paenibacillus]SDC39663.1 cytidylate kinase [Paenibacillus sp. cl123]SFW14035.1 cytidylate kinase [Paenibacillus sp. UNCCL117]
MEKFNIAIDGPAGAGKSTIARLVAGALGFVYVDTGAMYRAVTWRILEEGLQPDQTDEMISLTQQTDIRLAPGQNGQAVFVDGREVTGMIRSPEVTGNVSRISAIAGIRAVLTRKQKEMAAGLGIVMDGRDIGSHVLPDAEVKVFLTASVRIRAERRLKEIRDSQPGVTLEQLMSDIAQRDRMDEQREASPLVKAPDAVLIDTSDLSIDEVVHRILELAGSRVGGGK